MTYSIDLRERVVSFVKSGGSKAEAARRFQVHRSTVYDWISREDLRPSKPGSREHKLNKQALIQHVRNYPDALLRERAEHFGVSVNSIWYNLKQLNIRKKNDPLF